MNKKAYECTMYSVVPKPCTTVQLQPCKKCTTVQMDPEKIKNY